MPVLCQFFYYVFRKIFVYFVMPWDRLFLAGGWIFVEIMAAAMSTQNTS